MLSMPCRSAVIDRVNSFRVKFSLKFISLIHGNWVPKFVKKAQNYITLKSPCLSPGVGVVVETIDGVSGVVHVTQRDGQKMGELFSLTIRVMGQAFSVFKDVHLPAAPTTA